MPRCGSERLHHQAHRCGEAAVAGAHLVVFPARCARVREPLEETEIRLLLDAIYSRYHYDFRQYAIASLKRRLTQALDRLGCDTVTALQERVLHDKAAFP